MGLAAARLTGSALGAARDRLTRSQIGFLWSIVMPVIALFIILRVIPVLVVLLMSFTNFD